MNTYKKHRFNIFPEMQKEDYDRLKKDIAENGYDKTLPITIFRAILSTAGIVMRLVKSWALSQL